MGKSVAIVNNAVAMLRELKLTSGGRRSDEPNIFLLEKGREFVEVLKTNDKNKIKDFSKIMIKESDSELLLESLKLLKNDPRIPYATLGKLIRKKIGPTRPPKSTTTYINIGRTMKDVFLGFELLSEDIGRLRRSNHRRRLMNKLYPNIRAPDIFKMLHDFNDKNIWRIDIPEEFDIEKQDALRLARNLMDLDIASYIDFDKNILKLTEKGIQLKNAETDANRREIFLKILLGHPPVNDIIKKVVDIDEEFASIDIGNILNDYNKTDWSYRTKIRRGCILVNWLKETGIIFSSRHQGRYIVKDTFTSNFLKRPAEKLITEPQIEEKPVVIKEILSASDKEVIIGNIYRKIYTIKFSNDNKWAKDITMRDFFYENLNTLEKYTPESNLYWIEEAKNWLDQGFTYADKKCITEHFAGIITSNLNE